MFHPPAFTGIGVGGTGLEWRCSKVTREPPDSEQEVWGDRLFLQTLYRGSVCQASLMLRQRVWWAGQI